MMQDKHKNLNQGLVVSHVIPTGKAMGLLLQRRTCTCHQTEPRMSSEAGIDCIYHWGISIKTCYPNWIEA